MNASGPRVLPGDCESAESALLRQFLFYSENAAAFWLGVEMVEVFADKAAMSFEALGGLSSYKTKEGMK